MRSCARHGLGSSVVGVVDLCWRFGPEPTVEDQQADSEHAPDQAVDPHHPDGVGSVLPQSAGFDGAPVACAISVSNALPEAWLNNQAYQKVTAIVARVSIGLDPNWGIRVSGICQMVTPRAMSAVAASGVRVVCSLGCAQPRKLASSGSWALMGLTILMAIAIGRAYQTVNSAMCAAGAPNALFSPIDANLIASGTPSASAYQIQLTRQRINRDPMAFQPGDALGQGDDDECRDQDARGEEALPRNGAPAEGVGEKEKGDDGVSTDDRHGGLPVLRLLLT